MKITIENSKLGSGEVVLFVPDTAYGAVQILVERYRVLTEKGRTVGQDVTQYEFNELRNAAAAYLLGADHLPEGVDIPFIWPFSDESWHGGTDQLADLVRAGQFIAAEIDRLAYIASTARNPQPVMGPEDGGEVVTGRGKVLKRLTGYRSEGYRTLNPDIPETAVVFEPGEGSDPVTWFEGALLETEPPEQISPDKSDSSGD